MIRKTVIASNPKYPLPKQSHYYSEAFSYSIYVYLQRSVCLQHCVLLQCPICTPHSLLSFPTITALPSFTICYLYCFSVYCLLFAAFYARLARFERATYGFVVRRSFQLSYRRLLTIYIRIKGLSIDLFERIPELLTLNWILLNPISSPYSTLRLHIAH